METLWRICRTTVMEFFGAIAFVIAFYTLLALTLN